MRFHGFQAGVFIEIWIVAAALSMAAEPPVRTLEGALPQSVYVPGELGGHSEPTTRDRSSLPAFHVFDVTRPSTVKAMPALIRSARDGNLEIDFNNGDSHE